MCFSTLPAKILEANSVPQMAFKGRMQVGADSNITIVVRDSKVLPDVHHGHPIRLKVVE